MSDGVSSAAERFSYPMNYSLTGWCVLLAAVGLGGVWAGVGLLRHTAERGTGVWILAMGLFVLIPFAVFAWRVPARWLRTGVIDGDGIEGTTTTGRRIRYAWREVHKIRVVRRPNGAYTCVWLSGPAGRFAVPAAGTSLDSIGKRICREARASGATVDGI